MKPVVLLVVLFLSVVACIGFSVSMADAATGTVTPTVVVSSTASLSIDDGGTLQWGSVGAGSSVTGTVTASISSNTDWTLWVQATSGYAGTNELASDNHRIPASCFTFTSVAGTPAPPGGNGVADPTPFDGDNAIAVWSGGTATSGCGVKVVYQLEVPAVQQPGTYTATHTYTLVPS
ncbi:MAG: hypothetical protein DRI39_06260 [Chloroflexi bacterium]|nr:MAG: hypothetical protein DRI39_06260 [Chloroflexota bacterium]RLC97014.1 MAG: hypothetical protein DRI40_01475 [Chloroflexota bacterium]